MYQFLKNEDGTAAIEYSLFISLIVLVIAGALHALGGNLVDVFSIISGELTSVQVIEDHRSTGLLGEL